jgi:cellobiose-specific phosphotransferase system component IIC
MTPTASERRLRKVFFWLTALALAGGILSTLSYSVGAHIAVRYVNPEFGAWWNDHEFQVMELSASMLGMLIAIRSGARLVEAGRLRQRSKLIALIIAIVVALPLARGVSIVAGSGWDAESSYIRDYLIATASYGVGNILDKVVIGGVYFLKSTAFALLVGFALYALVASLLIGRETSSSATGSPQAPTQ